MLEQTTRPYPLSLGPLFSHQTLLASVVLRRSFSRNSGRAWIRWTITSQPQRPSGPGPETVPAGRDGGLDEFWKFLIAFKWVRKVSGLFFAGVKTGWLVHEIWQRAERRHHG